MQTPFPFEPFLAFGTMAVCLLLGIFLRAKVKFFQNFFIPSCIIGGFLGMLVLNFKIQYIIDLLPPDWRMSLGIADQTISILPFEGKTFEAFVYHFFIISFISIGLTYNKDNDGQKDKTKSIFKGATWMAMIEGVTISLQAIVGCLFVMLFGLFGVKLFKTFGLFLPLGFTEGPGQALSFGQVWETQFGFENASTIGLTFAAIGFLVAFFVGIPLIRWGVKKGLPVVKTTVLPEDLLTGIISKDQQREKAGELTTHSGNVETLALHMALIGLVYILTYMVTWGLVKITSPNIAKSLFGFFFFFGLINAIIVRIILNKLGIRHIIDPGIQRRITGWAVDFLIIGTIMAIQLVVVWEYIVPIASMSVAAAILTTWAILYLGKRIDTLNFERTMAIFGTCTGTVSTGLLLLRVVDPEFRTPVALEIGLMNVVVAPIIVASMILVNAPVWWDWGLWLVIGAHVALLVVSLVLIKVLKMWGAPKY